MYFLISERMVNLVRDRTNEGWRWVLVLLEQICNILIFFCCLAFSPQQFYFLRNQQSFLDCEYEFYSLNRQTYSEKSSCRTALSSHTTLIFGCSVTTCHIHSIYVNAVFQRQQFCTLCTCMHIVEPVRIFSTEILNFYPSLC